MHYKKSQFGWIIIGLFVPIILFFPVSYIYQWGNHPIPLAPMLILTGVFVFVYLLFYKLTIEVNGQFLKLTYGVGLIKFKFKIDTLLETNSVKTPWYYGLGIRITPKGMLYNIHSLRALEIKFISNHSNKRITVGTPEPELLKKVLTNIYSK